MAIVWIASESKQAHDLTTWLNSSMGNKKWYYCGGTVDSTTLQIKQCIWFEREEDATLFALRWA